MSEMTENMDAELDRLTQRLEQDEQTVLQGGEPDLRGLDAEIEALCGRVRALPREDSGELRGKLQSLLDTVDRLSTAMRSRYDALKDEMQDHGRRAQATRAYGQGKTRSGQER